MDIMKTLGAGLALAFVYGGMAFGTLHIIGHNLGINLGTG